MELGEVVSTKFGAEAVPASALSNPAPLMLPQPVARSYPVIAENPLLPLVMSWNAAL